MGDGAARWTPALCASRSIPTLDDVLVGVHLSHGPWFAQQAPPDAGQVAKPGGQTAREQGHAFGEEIGRAHVCTPVTNAHLVCRLLPEKKKTQTNKKNANIINKQTPPK